MPSGAVNITMNFDSHIQKVTYVGQEWTTSGQTINSAVGTAYPFVVSLDDGYVIDDVTITGDWSLNRKTDTEFYVNAGNGAWSATITSKSSGVGRNDE